MSAAQKTNEGSFFSALIVGRMDTVEDGGGPFSGVSLAQLRVIRLARRIDDNGKNAGKREYGQR